MQNAMRTQFEFRSSAFPAYSDAEERINPGRFGKRLAEFLQAVLPSHGFAVRTIGNEDWGWMVELENESFPLWIGCGNVDGTDDEFLCFIEPAKPEVRRGFKKVPTAEIVEKLAVATEAALTGSGKVSDFRWVA
jgi:hypothetical protein